MSGHSCAAHSAIRWPGRLRHGAAADDRAVSAAAGRASDPQGAAAARAAALRISDRADAREAARRARSIWASWRCRCRAEGLEARELYAEPFMVALPRAHRLAERAQVRVEDLQGETLLLLEDGHCLRDQALEVAAAWACTRSRTSAPPAWRLCGRWWPPAPASRCCRSSRAAAPMAAPRGGACARSRSPLRCGRSAASGAKRAPALPAIEAVCKLIAQHAMMSPSPMDGTFDECMGLAYFVSPGERSVDCWPALAGCAVRANSGPGGRRMPGFAQLPAAPPPPHTSHCAIREPAPSP